MSAGARRWFDALPAVTGAVACGDRIHHITWRRGKLVLEDHDVLAERSLAALGAEPPWCVQILEAWRKPDLAIGMLDSLLLDDAALARNALLSCRARYEQAVADLKQARVIPAPAAFAKRIEDVRLAELHREQRLWAITLIDALPAELRRRFALAAIVYLARHLEDPVQGHLHRERVESTLRAVAAPAFERSVRFWRRNLKPYLSVVVETRVPGPGGQPGCQACIDNSGGRATLTLPLAWFTDVWARGIALVDDCFVLRRGSHAGGATWAHVIAVRFERTSRDLSRAVEAPAIVTRGANGEWSLRWL